MSTNPQILNGDIKDLGGFSVRRIFPVIGRKSVGPFVFFDHFGPAEFPPDEGIDVRPHPHIGLATVTYLFEGEIVHRDSLGIEQAIQPGAVNLMTAGRGIVHSERSGDDRDRHSRLHGLQTWMALPEDQVECDPAFDHYPAADLPDITMGGIRIRIIAGEVDGTSSPVKCPSPTLYLDCISSTADTFQIPEGHRESAVYVISGEVEVSGDPLSQGAMMIFDNGEAPFIHAGERTRFVVIGGEPLGPRKLWWNFVALDRERIEQAAEDWRQNRFPQVPGEHEWIPLPE